MRKWCLVRKQGITVDRAPRRFRALALAEAAFLAWRDPRLSVTVEPNRR
jgi:hypothetical protein